MSVLEIRAKQESNTGVQLHEVAPGNAGYSLVLHGGAGGRLSELALDQHGEYSGGLAAAYECGEQVLAAGGSALDAVCAAVEALEDNPLFNAGRGAALTTDGRAELDASVASGDGRAGAVAVSRHSKNPVWLARSVMERSAHVLLVAPPREVVQGWGLELADPDYFVTPFRQDQLRNVQLRLAEAPRHGTVGAVARDSQGRIASATSTGGMVNQHEGRVGDTPVIGAGIFARDDVAGISCTGEGEAFIEGIVACNIAARMRFGGQPLGRAACDTIVDELGSRSANGGIVAIDSAGNIVVAHNSPAMFAAFRRDGRLVTLT